MSSGNSSSFSVPQIKRKSRYQGTRFALRIKSSIYVACLQNTRKNSIVWPTGIADDPASLAFEPIETIIWKLPIAPVARIVSKYFETTGAIIWKPGFINNTHEKLNYNNKFWQRARFSSFNWLAETDYYLWIPLSNSNGFFKTNTFKVFQLRTWKCAKIDFIWSPAC